MAVAALTLFFPSRPAIDGRLPNRLVLRIASPQPVAAMALYDRFAGYQERFYAETAVAPSQDFLPLEVPLPAGQIIGLIFRVTATDGIPIKPIEIADVHVVAEDGTVVHLFSPADIAPGRTADGLVRTSGALYILPQPGSDSVEVGLKFGARLVLPDDSPAGRAAVAPVVHRERWLAIALLVSGAVALFWIVHDRERAGSPPVDGPSRALEIGTLALATAAIVFSRRPDVFANPQFWAEDGVIFYVGQHERGCAAFMQTYAGYLHLFSRVVALAAQPLSAGWTPTVFVYAALAVVVLTTTKAASRRVNLPFPYWSALAIVLVPNIGEIVLPLTNSQWFAGTFLLLVALSQAPANTRELACDLGAVVVFGLSGPFGVLFLPLLAYRAWRERTWGTILTVAAAGVVAGIQLASFAHTTDNRDWHGFDLLLLVSGVGYRTVGQLLGVLPRADWEPPAMWGYVALVLWGLLWIALPTHVRLQRAKVVLAFAVAAVVGGGMLRYGAYPVDYFCTIHVGRYFHLPLLATIWLVIGGLTFTGWRRVLAAVLLLVMIVQSLPHYRVTPMVDFDWSYYAAAIDRGEDIEAPINPQPWTVIYRQKPN